MGITDIFNLILYQPLFNVLVLLYEYIPGQDFGVAIIALTILIKLAFYPLGSIAIKSQKNLSTLQPKIKEIQEKHKDNKEKQMKEMMELYKQEKINPFSGCLPILVQLPVLIALYQVFRLGLDPEQLSLLYSFIPTPEVLNSTFLGVLNLARPNIVLAVAAGMLQFLQVRMVMPQPAQEQRAKQSDFARIFQKQMQYFFPGFSILLLLGLPSAIGLYWLTTTLFSIVQQYVILRKKKEVAMP